MSKRPCTVCEAKTSEPAEPRLTQPRLTLLLLPGMYATQLWVGDGISANCGRGLSREASQIWVRLVDKPLGGVLGG